MSLERYHALRDQHRWVVPQRYNVAADVCDKHNPATLAMIRIGEDGRERKIYWGELQSLANQFANYLCGLGVRRGDRVAVLLAPGLEAAAAVLGVLKIGAIGAPMARLWGNESIRYRLEDADAAALITDAETDVEAVCPPQTRLVLVGDSTAEGAATTIGDMAALRRGPTTFETLDTHCDDPALIYYTSGSTGRPKGVVTAHRGIIGHNEFEYCQDLRPGELSYWMGDWGWGVYKVLGPWRLGAINLVHQSRKRYDPAGLLAALSKHQVSNIFLNPTGLRLMMREVPDAGERFPQHFRVCCSANEPLGAIEAQWFAEQFGIPVLENYGMTEAYPMVGNFPGVPTKTGSMGLPVPGWDVHILDDQLHEVPTGETGEICLRARTNPAYPLGYWGRPEASRETFGGDWFHTNDLAYRDGDGYFFYVGRKDEVIKASGYRISPYEVEEACQQHPAVEHAAVFGVPDPVRGQTVAGLIALADDYQASPEVARQIKTHVRDTHSTFAYPRQIEFVDALPESQSGKLNRTEARARFLTITEPSDVGKGVSQ